MSEPRLKRVNLSRVFIERPVGSVLLAVAVLLLGVLALRMLPVSPMPQVDYPVISVSATMPGAGPETMAATVATPLERALGTIPGVTQITSSSSQGSTNVNLQFDLGRNIDDAARDVQAAINVARSQLPSGMPGLPQYRKVNPSQAPIMVLALTSDHHTPGQLYDLAATVLAQKLAQVPGVGQVTIGGGSLPAVRVSINPNALNHQGLALDEVVSAIRSANAMQPLGSLEDASRRWQVEANLQLVTADDYRDLLIAWRNGRPVRLGEVAAISEGTENRYAAGFHNDRDAVLMLISRQPQANIIQTVDAVNVQLPILEALLPEAVTMTRVIDRSPTIRATLHEAQITLLIAIALVVLVVLAFLGNVRAALVPTFAIPVSLGGALAIIWLLGFSLNTLSLMALIVATVLVVDDAIVVLENISRHLEQGRPPLQAALQGAREVGATLLSMNVALSVVFLSILFLDDFVERLFREFSVTLVAAMLVSLLVSLSLTPSLCARLLRPHDPNGAQPGKPENRVVAWMSHQFDRLRQGYLDSLDACLRFLPVMLIAFVAVVGLNVWLFGLVPKGVVPVQDTGQLRGFARGDDGLSFQVMQPKLAVYRQVLAADPGINEVAGFIGGSMGINNAMVMAQAKPFSERGVSSQEVVDRVRTNTPPMPGGSLWMRVDQDINLGGAGAGPMNRDGYQLRLLSDDLEVLQQWTPIVGDALTQVPELVDVETSGDEGARQVVLDLDRDAAARLGVDVRTIANVLDNSFSQRQVATRYDSLNQYRVVMELDQRYTQSPDTLEQIYAIAADGRRVPLSAFASYRFGMANDRVQHRNQFASTNIDFALAPGIGLEQASVAIQEAMAGIMLPNQVIAVPDENVSMLQRLASQQLFLVLGAALAVFLVLGILYESTVLPLVILSSLPSATVGALLALLWFGSELNLISMLGLFLLIGVVMKNTILLVDFALAGERDLGLSPDEAVRESARLRFRPILMTSVAALLGTLPLIPATGEGWEMRQPLGVAIVGGLFFSQVLTLYTTPAIYLALSRLRHRVLGRRDTRGSERSPGGDAALADSTR